MRAAPAVGVAKLIGLDANEAADAIAAFAADGVGALHAEPLAIEQAISSAITGVRAVCDIMLAGCRHRSGPG
jgi:2-methylcitrate dehydratase